jgi:heterodisulfide reductase subunit C
VALETEGKFNPRTIIQFANCGYEERLLFDFTPDVFDCTCCEICEEVCPQNVKLHETFMIIKNLRGQESYIPDSYTSETEQVYLHGKAVPMQEAINKRRKQLGLQESVKTNADEIRQLMDMTPVKDVLARKAAQMAEAAKKAENAVQEEK